MKSMIQNIETIIDTLPPENRDLCKRIFNIHSRTGSLAPPPEMEPWIIERFGSLDAVKTQTIIIVENRLTFHCSLFNELRAKRPVEAAANIDIESSLKDNRECSFCSPLTETPADTFGRIQGKHCITASNAAKYDALHGLVIFKQHYPFDYDAEHLADYVDTAMRWLEAAHQTMPDHIFPFIMWNCTWRAGASITHGHMQTLLSPQPYARVSFLHHCANVYQNLFAADYWKDLGAVHTALNLSVEHEGILVFAHLNPIKEKEIWIIGHAADTGLSWCISRVLKCYYDMGVRAFNMSLVMPPLVTAPEWADFPLLVRLVDRGNLKLKVTDIAAMEFYGGSVISSDPFALASLLRPYFNPEQSGNRKR